MANTLPNGKWPIQLTAGFAGTQCKVWRAKAGQTPQPEPKPFSLLPLLSAARMLAKSIRKWPKS